MDLKRISITGSRILPLNGSIWIKDRKLQTTLSTGIKLTIFRLMQERSPLVFAATDTSNVRSDSLEHREDEFATNRLPVPLNRDGYSHG